MIKEIVTLGSEMLGQKAHPVTEFSDDIRKLVRDMFDTLAANPGIGLAGPQVGEMKRLFVIKLDDGVERVFINPEITATSADTSVYEEGCLSIPGLWHDVTRSRAVSVFAYDENGKPFNLDADGLLARCIQHEFDHLEGKLFIDRIGDEERERMVRLYEKRRKGKRR